MRHCQYRRLKIGVVKLVEFKEKISLSILESELEKAGAPRVWSEISKILMSPLTTMVNCGISSRPYLDIILKFAPKLDMSDKAWVARALTEKGLKKAVPFLLSIYYEYEGEKIDLWAVGNALSVINDKTSYAAVLELCKDPKYGSARQMLIGLLAKMRTEESYNVLIESLTDSTIRAHAIEALGLFGNIKAIEVLEQLNVTKGFYEYRAKTTALERLNKKLLKESL